jgi:hypothetical protein
VYVGPKRVHTDENGTVFIHCRVVAEPLITQVGWLRNDVPVELDDRHIMHYNNTLEIRRIEYGDRAKYTCTASNPAGGAGDDSSLLVVGMFETEACNCNTRAQTRQRKCVARWAAR